MSRPSDPHVYPLQFLQYVEEFTQNQKLRVEIPFDSVSEAKSFRLAFYSFRTGAMKEEMHKNPMYAALPLLMVQVLTSPPRAVMSHKDHGDLSARMEAAMQKAKEPQEIKPVVQDIIAIWQKGGLNVDDVEALRDGMYRRFFFRTMKSADFNAAFDEAKRILAK